jgi:prepilin-type N-terminal cleavage/methylation domain-containing protein
MRTAIEPKPFNSVVTEHLSEPAGVRPTHDSQSSGRRLAPRFDASSFRRSLSWRGQRPSRIGVSGSAFTLVEVMVVMGILAVLVVLALSTASSLLADSRAKQTKATMKVLDAALEQFIRDYPFSDKGHSDPVNSHILRQLIVPNSAPPPTNWTVNCAISRSYAPDSLGSMCVSLFDRYPPCPLTAFAPNPALLLPPIGFTDTRPLPDTHDDDPITAFKFSRLINVMKGFDIPLHPSVKSPWWMRNDQGAQIGLLASLPSSAHTHYAEHYSSIECFFFTLYEFSPAARKILDQLQGKPALANLDKDFTFHDVTNNRCDAEPNASFDSNCLEERKTQVPLYEVLDAFPTDEYPRGRPIRYAIREAIRTSTDPNAPPAAPIKWELRSAGVDGVFAPPFTDESGSDDVVLQGPCAGG